MAGLPNLWFNLEMQPGANNCMSFVSPYDECTVTMQCDQHIKSFRCWRVYGKYDGTQKGKKFLELTNRDANVQIPFTIKAQNVLDKGDGLYTIILVVENDEGNLNLYQYLLTTETDSSHLQLYEATDKFLAVNDPMQEPEPEE